MILSLLNDKEIMAIVNMMQQNEKEETKIS